MNHQASQGARICFREIGKGDRDLLPLRGNSRRQVSVERPGGEGGFMAFASGIDDLDVEISAGILAFDPETEIRIEA